MGDLNDIAQEYLKNVAIIEERIAELEERARGNITNQQLLGLRRRINILYRLAGEGRQLAFRMQHYYDKPKGESEIYDKTYPSVRRTNTDDRRFRTSGYGAPAPASAMYGRELNAAPVSGLRAQLSGRHDAAGNC